MYQAQQRRLQIRIPCSNLKIDVRILAQGHLDLLQVDLPSFLANAASFLGREKAKETTKSREVVLRRPASYKIGRRTFLKVQGSLCCHRSSIKVVVFITLNLTVNKKLYTSIVKYDSRQE